MYEQNPDMYEQNPDMYEQNPDMYEQNPDMYEWGQVLTHTYLGSFFLDPEDIKSLSLGAIWNFSKATGLL